ncbi:hypothetical protein A0J61_04471 [Choanephora cucurbitarum]|uniref:Uncharacterized protein n=1 Tax=Choanephora cucurbitarum TaxID=101091 RepID=A0A1C7NFE6_9FUNG|nr:hypothetical protein A0J61_04471 [Choanephora cucurbitarum]
MPQKSSDYLTSIFQWISSASTVKDQRASLQDFQAKEDPHKANPRQQLLHSRNLKRSRRRSLWRTLPESDIIVYKDALS